jgi:hypothetical protein
LNAASGVRVRPVAGMQRPIVFVAFNRMGESFVEEVGVAALDETAA